LYGQTPATRLEFEVASVKPSPPMTPGSNVSAGVHIDGAQVRCTMLALKDYIAIAYQLKHHQVVGPEWIAGERYDVVAKIPEGTKREQLPEMLQHLLADRFQMKSHREKRDFPVYAVVVGKGPLKLRESEPDPPPAEGTDPAKAPVSVNATGGRGGTTINFGNGRSFTIADNKFVGKKLPISGFAETLARFTDRPVIDASELKGTYDFEMEFSPEDFRAMMVRSAIAAGVMLPPEAMKALEASGDSLFAAVQALGLRLDSRKAPIDVLVVDSVLKVPTEN
jgi:uncharacterized protein (TIGR03435 family)